MFRTEAEHLEKNKIRLLCSLAEQPLLRAAAFPLLVRRNDWGAVHCTPPDGWWGVVCRST